MCCKHELCCKNMAPDSAGLFPQLKDLSSPGNELYRAVSVSGMASHETLKGKDFYLNGKVVYIQ